VREFVSGFESCLFCFELFLVCARHYSRISVCNRARDLERVHRSQLVNQLAGFFFLSERLQQSFHVNKRHPDTGRKQTNDAKEADLRYPR